MKKIFSMILLITVLVAIVGCTNDNENNNNNDLLGKGLFFEFDSTTNTYGVKGYNKGYYGFSNDENDQISLIIPDTYNGYTVNKILAFAFKDLSELKSIVIPNTITDIEEHVFSGCHLLFSIEIPDSVIKISENAFDGYDGNVYKNVVLTLDNYANYFEIDFKENGIGMYAANYTTQYHQTTEIHRKHNATYINDYNYTLTVKGTLTLDTPYIDEIEHGFAVGWGNYMTIIKNESIFTLDISSYELYKILSTVKFLDGIGYLEYADVKFEYELLDITGTFTYDVKRTGLIVEETDDIDDANPDDKLIQLTLENYEEYFFVQREIESWNVTEYIQNTYFKKYKVDVRMRLKILPRVNNITFNNVVISFSFDESNIKTGEPLNPPPGYVHSYWKGKGGDLILSIKGEGFLQLMSYWDESYIPNDISTGGLKTFEQPPYVVTAITGSIILE